MRVRIIKNNPPSSDIKDVSKYIGQIFETENVYEDGDISIEEIGMVYKGEYEVFDIQKELGDFIKKYFECDNPVDQFNVKEFILHNRVGLLKILQV